MAYVRPTRTPFVPYPAEPLENRIAPAFVFFSGTDTEFKGISLNDAALAATFGSGAAIVLASGNSLVVDVNGDGKFKAADDILIGTVSRGRGVFFFTDLDNSTELAPDELTGLLVSNGFSGIVADSIEGPVVTGLSPSGTPVLVEGRSDIAGLNVGGRIAGSILADGSVKNVTVQNIDFGDSPSVAEIVTGSGADGKTYSLNGGTTQATFESTQERSSPDIVGISLAEGTSLISAGSASVGGIISKVTIGEQHTDLVVSAGAATPLSGGAGGSISKVTIKSAKDSAAFSFLAGDGAIGAARNGAGGSVSSVFVEAGSEAVIGTITVAAGDGGNPSNVPEDFESAASGGSGGSIKGVFVHADTVPDVIIQAGDGGDGGYIYHPAETETREKQVKQRDLYGNVYWETVEYEVVVKKAVRKGGAGGSGGSISGVTVNALSAMVEMDGGDGGSALTKPAGSGGSILKSKFDGVDGVNAEAGESGAGTRGGAGGSVKDFTAVNLGVGADVALTATQGGFGIKGGAAGSISKVTLKSDNEISEVTLVAGKGADGFYEEEDDSTYGARPGGVGGAVSNVLVDVKSAEVFQAAAGDGGQGGRSEVYFYTSEGSIQKITGAPGGAGGSISKVTFKALEADAVAQIYGGAGGRGRVNKNGGAGGKISNVTLENIATLDMQAGDGGLVDEFGRGSAGGAISGLAITGGRVGSALNVSAGNGSAGAGGASGGAGGNISKITKLDVLAGAVNIHAGNGADGSSIYVPPEYKEVEKKVRVRGEYGEIYYEYVTVEVKVRNYIAKAGAGGAGGSVSGVAMKALSGADTPITVNAGNGGMGKSITAEVERRVAHRGLYGEIYYDYVTVEVTRATKPAGSGGSITGLALSALTGSTASLAAIAGNGGAGEGVAKTGVGGKISGVTAISEGTMSNFTLRGGAGGAADGDSERGRGAAGGGISKIIVKVTQNITGVASVIAGSGGEGLFKAGAGGSISGASITAANVFTVEFTPGEGSPPGTLKEVSPL